MLVLLIFQSLILSEVMYNPSSSEHHNEFVEVFNRSKTDSFDLGRYQISDGKGVDALLYFSGNRKVAPQSYALILDASYPENSSLYQSLIPENTVIYLTADNSIGSGGLSNSSSELVILYDEDFMIADSIRYQLGAENGFSYERRIHFGDEWRFSDRELGSPGFQNTVDRFIETITADLSFKKSEKEYRIVLKNHEQEKRHFSFSFHWELYKREIDSFSLSKSKEEFQELELEASDSIELSRSVEIRYPAQYNLRSVLEIDTLLVAGDSISFVYSPNQFPLWFSYLKLTKPQIIEMKNPTNFPFYLDVIQLKGSGNFKEIHVNKVLNAGESFRLSKHSFEEVDVFDENIPFLYRKNGNLAIDFNSDLDSIQYHIDSLFFEKESESIIPLEYRAYNYLTEWIINPNRDGRRSDRPEKFKLELSANPFNPRKEALEITLEYKDYDSIQLRIYTIYGRLLKEIQEKEIYTGVGKWMWNGKSENGRYLSSGLYLLLFKGKRKKDGRYELKKFPLVIVR